MRVITFDRHTMTHTGENSFRLPKFERMPPKLGMDRNVYEGHHPAHLVKWKTSFNFVIL